MAKGSNMLNETRVCVQISELVVTSHVNIKIHVILQHYGYQTLPLTKSQ